MTGSISFPCQNDHYKNNNMIMIQSTPVHMDTLGGRLMSVIARVRYSWVREKNKLFFSKHIKSLNNGCWTKYFSVRLSERKTSEKKSSGKRGGGRISVIARVRNNRSLFQSFLIRFGGLALVSMAGCP